MSAAPIEYAQVFAEFPVFEARCAVEGLGLEWVPAYEQYQVPPMVARICGECDVRQQCLQWAVAEKERGYWAGTTTRDRRPLW